MAEELEDDLNSPEWQDFAAKLLKARVETPKTSIASPSFIERMTDPAADPGGDQPRGKKD
jgi:hypothetical protein